MTNENGMLEKVENGQTLDQAQEISDSEKQINELLEKVGNGQTLAQAQEISNLKKQIEAQNKLIEQISGRDIQLETDIKEECIKKMCPTDTWSKWKNNVVVSIDPDISNLAAKMFEYLVPPNASDRTVGVAFSGGRAIRDMVTKIQRRYTELNVYPLSCAGMPEDVAYSVDTVIGMFCAKYQAPGTEIKGYTFPGGIEFGPNMKRSYHDGFFYQWMTSMDYAFTGLEMLMKMPLSQKYTAVMY